MPSPRHTFVLVHGAWHGGWCWRRVADILEGQGHKVFTPTLTGLCDRSHLMSHAITLQTHVDDIVNLIAWERLENICLVGHSYGGMPISLVAEAVGEKISSFVFLDAFVPENGETPLDLITPHVQADIRAAMARGEVSRPSPSAAYFKVIDAADIAWVDSLTTPHPNGVWVQKMALTGAREKIAKKSYIRAGLYPNAIFDAHMEKCRTRPGWRVHIAPAGHDVMVDAPVELAKLLVEAA